MLYIYSVTISNMCNENIRICQYCWKEFHPRSWQKYCSNECSWKSKIKLEDRVCKFCWKEFHPKDATQHFCSKECGYANRRTLYDKVCEVCWKVFKPYYKEQKYCSNECAFLLRAIPEVKCRACWKVFKPYYSGQKYCNLKCRWVAQSRYINSLSDEEKRKRMEPLYNANPNPKSSYNIKFAQFLNDNGYCIDTGDDSKDMEFFVWGTPFDIKVKNTLIEINPNIYHNVTTAPKWKPKWRSYHQDKAIIAINHWYNVIMVRDWDDKQDILNLLNWVKYDADEIKVWLDKCMYTDIIKSWYKLINISEPTAHWYNKKTKEHIIDVDDDMQGMIEKWFVKIYDCWMATFT